MHSHQSAREMLDGSQVFWGNDLKPITYVIIMIFRTSWPNEGTRDQKMPFIEMFGQKRCRLERYWIQRHKLHGSQRVWLLSVDSGTDTEKKFTGNIDCQYGWHSFNKSRSINQKKMEIPCLLYDSVYDFSNGYERNAVVGLCMETYNYEIHN